MSSRAMKKLHGGSDLPAVAAADDDDDSGQKSDDGDVRRPGGGGGARPKTNRNPFEMLDGSSRSESEVKEDDDLGTESSRSKAEKRQVNDEKRRKPKKKKNRKRVNVVPKSSGDNVDAKDVDGKAVEDEVERSVSEVNRMLGEPPKQAPSSSSTKEAAKTSGLLCIEYKHLNPENEMRKIFGARVVSAESMVAGAAARQHRRAGGRVRAQVRSQHCLVVPRPNWPPPGKIGLAMKFLDSDASGNQFFSFEHSQRYQDVQKRFFEAVNSLNPDFIVQLLNAHPFHVDAMLQLSDICKMGEDLQMATELIERTVFVMETALHPLFNLAVGTSRLDYRRQENRAFFIALFRHLSSVGSRACHRTALEFCKLILSLDPEADPLGALLMIDFYALRAQQYGWLIRLYDEWEPRRNLSQLPNFAFSVAVAHFYRDSTASASASASASTADGDASEDALGKADELLQSALIAFPGVLLPLLDKCSIEPDTRVQTSRFFMEAQIGQPTALSLLINLYVGRGWHVWKAPELLPWLERNVNEVLARVEADDPAVKESAEKRRVRYQGTPRNIYRHVIISDIKDATTSLPVELTRTAVLSYDPLPPTDSIDLYASGGGAGGAAAAAEGQDASVVGLFLRSFLPNFNPADPASSAATETAVADAAAAAGQGDLRRSVTTLMGALQDLIGNLHLPEVPNDADRSADEELEDDDEQWR